MTLTVTKAKICQAHICILLLTLTSFVPHFFSLSLSQIIALEEDEPKLFTKTIQQGKKLFTKTNKNNFSSSSKSISKYS